MVAPRPWPRAVGAGVAVLVAFATLALVAMPLCFPALATEPASGLDRPLVHDGLRAAPAIGAVTSLAAGVWAAWRWRRPGGEAGAS